MSGSIKTCEVYKTSQVCHYYLQLTMERWCCIGQGGLSIGERPTRYIDTPYALLILACLASIFSSLLLDLKELRQFVLTFSPLDKPFSDFGHVPDMRCDEVGF
jgi:hypothetical protein